MEKELSEEEARRAKGGGEGGLKRYASGLPTRKQLAEMEREEAGRAKGRVLLSPRLLD